ncbi:shikimate 5-dehydrogenase [Marivirga tractuosa]|uniref:Shikimate dehydrogenase n=1 Tax=Marivirga tractuosa (strain ATCC 23168 / DSM 4126 / NBRC 15989 / NCIMB 1408 / VKM B-1430 / H-43) TaxID=643867 RepID=E4TQC7_MARTH|nr:shikimate dehydrogenase [Marivirga tractuosa]ADR22650.1 shikimate dehydrogenase [Marivirga tractuosa DSM 4126]BDD16679.1 shikimate 5-dehydrogenase [Marivirga tractuosa]
MNTFGLIGYPLEHSFSGKYFTDKFEKEQIQDCEYRLFPLEDIKAFDSLKEQNLAGLNVTIPYKEQIIPYLDELDEHAKAIGAVNVIQFTNGKTKGYNSDYYGFKDSLIDFIPEGLGSKALILGTGGASKAIKQVLKDLSIPFKVVSRKEGFDFTYEELNSKAEILQEYHLLINTTPLGTFPKVEEKPHIPYHALTQNHYLYDLVYNPAKTAFMKEGGSQGAKVINGLEMLIGQAEKSWEIWNRS